MDTSIFSDKAVIPDNTALRLALGDKYLIWQSIKEYVYLKYPKATEGWSYPGRKYGWSFRIKDQKRVIIYLIPGEEDFMVAFMFGQKATEAVLDSDIDNTIRNDLAAATVYVEGRGIRIPIQDKMQLEDIKKLIDIKLSY